METTEFMFKDPKEQMSNRPSRRSNKVKILFYRKKKKMYEMWVFKKPKQTNKTYRWSSGSWNESIYCMQKSDIGYEPILMRDD